MIGPDLRFSKTLTLHYYTYSRQKMDVLQANYNKLFDEINEWRELVNFFSKLIPPKSNPLVGSAFQKYLEFLNFLWTEYDYIYKGGSVSAYRNSMPKQMHFDAAEKEISKQLKQKKKGMEAQMIEALDAKLSSLGLEITEAQKQLKDSAKAIVTKAVEKQFSILQKTNERYIPFYVHMVLDGISRPFDKTCPGLDSSTAENAICTHPWFPQSPDSRPRKNQKVHGGLKKKIVDENSFSSSSSSSSSAAIRKRALQPSENDPQPALPQKPLPRR